MPNCKEVARLIASDELADHSFRSLSGMIGDNDEEIDEIRGRIETLEGENSELTERAEQAGAASAVVKP